MALRTINTAELDDHKTEKSCWVTIDGKVYDVTEFLDSHPGGVEYIVDYAGDDVKEIMMDFSTHEHSESAFEILGHYQIGVLGTAAGLAPPTPPRTPNPNSLTGMDSEKELSIDTDLAADYKQNKFLDLNRPLLAQLWFSGFSKDFYLEQVHKPRHYKNGESAPLFGNFLEPLSKTPWFVVPIIWVPVVSYGVYLANQGLPNAAATGMLFVLGLCIWTLVEYFLHRCLFHLDEKMPDNRVMITLHFLLHGIHHYLPMDRLRLVMPPTLFCVLALPWWKFAHTLFFWHWHIGTAIYCGGVAGYICYDLTHYFLHHRQLPAYYRELKKYHLQHHYKDYQKGYGVTSKFWDRVFDTELYMGPGLKTQ